MTDIGEPVDLNDPNSYAESVDYTMQSMLSAYNLLCQRFLIEIDDSIDKHNDVFRTYIVRRGIETINSVFTSSLLHTRRLVSACNITRTAITLFIEFVSQTSHDRFNHLQLSIRDAMLFAFKKTILGIPREIKANFVSNETDTLYMTTLRSYIQLSLSIHNTIADEDISLSHPTKDFITELDDTHKKIIKILLLDIDDNERHDLVAHALQVKNKLDLFLSNRRESLVALRRIYGFYRSRLMKGANPTELMNRVVGNLSCQTLIDTYRDSNPVNTENLVRDIMRKQER